MTWEETRLSGPEPVAVRASRRLISGEGLMTDYSGVRLRMDLDLLTLASMLHRRLDAATVQGTS